MDNLTQAVSGDQSKALEGALWDMVTRALSIRTHSTALAG